MFVYNSGTYEVTGPYKYSGKWSIDSTAIVFEGLGKGHGSQLTLNDVKLECINTVASEGALNGELLSFCK